MIRYQIKMVFSDKGKEVIREAPAVENSYQEAFLVANSLVLGYCGTFGWKFVSMEVKDANAPRQTNNEA